MTPFLQRLSLVTGKSTQTLRDEWNKIRAGVIERFGRTGSYEFVRTLAAFMDESGLTLTELQKAYALVQKGVPDHPMGAQPSTFTSYDHPAV